MLPAAGESHGFSNAGLINRFRSKDKEKIAEATNKLWKFFCLGVAALKANAVCVSIEN